MTMIKYFVRAIIERDGKFLVMREKKRNDRWVFPGGAMDDSDNRTYDALSRELHEEIGLVPTCYIFSHFFSITIEDTDWVGWYYRVEVEGEPAIQEPDKCLELKWVTEEELAELPCREGALRIE